MMHLFLADTGRVRFCITDPGIAEGLALVPGAYARRASRTALQPAGLMAADRVDTAPLSDLNVLQCEHSTELSVTALLCWVIEAFKALWSIIVIGRKSEVKL